MSRIQYRSRRALTVAARGPRADIWPENDYHAGATVVVDDPREPVIQAIGILDQHGDEMLKITMPIKVPMGFALPANEGHDDQDEVVSFIPESLLSVSNVGLGLGYVTPAEADEGYEEEDEEDGDAEEAGETVTVRIPATPEVVAAHAEMGAASEAVGAQINRLHLNTTEEGLLVLRGLISVQTDALVTFLRVCAAARKVKDPGDEQA